MQEPNQTELLQLLSRLVDESLDDESQQRLAVLLKNKEARRLYLMYLELHSDLAMQANRAEAGSLPSRTRGPAFSLETTAVGSQSRIAIQFAALVIVLLISSAGIWWNQNLPVRNSVGAATEAQATGFAVIAGQADAVWDGDSPMSDGSLVPQGPLKLTSGIVQLELFSGVSVIIEGAAEFSIQSPMQMSVKSGRIQAQVPDAAHGFSILTGEGKVVDLGTEFAINVSGGHTDLHVLDGEIEWQSEHHRQQKDDKQNTNRMIKGQAIRWMPDGSCTEIATGSHDFIDREKLRTQLLSTRVNKRLHWQQFSESMQHDPRLLAWYQTGAVETWSRLLPNQAKSSASIAGEGAIVAASSTVDRWGQAERALDFSPTGSRVRVSVPGQHPALTLLCWVKINSLDRWYNSLFLTDGHEMHEPHWQIMDDGRLFFSVKKRDKFDTTKGEKAKHIFYSPTFWNSTMSGQWLMIATVYDPVARRVTHFLNGKMLSSETIPDEYLVENVSIGNASLCNWGLPELGWIAGSPDESRFAIRNLNGSMDEFVLFRAALTAEEIRKFYDHGKP